MNNRLRGLHLPFQNMNNRLRGSKLSHYEQSHIAWALIKSYENILLLNPAPRQF